MKADLLLRSRHYDVTGTVRSHMEASLQSLHSPYTNLGGKGIDTEVSGHDRGDIGG